MQRRLWAGVGALALGSVFFVAAQVAGSSSGGGVLQVGAEGSSVQVDPQLADINTAWWLEDATGAYLYRWSRGAKLVPEVASRVVVSNSGLAYTFTLRRGFRFSDGTPVTAGSFAYAIRRLRNRDLASSGAALAVGIARVTASGRRLVVRLAHADPALLSKLALPFFQATSTKLPLNREVAGPYPSTGRYAYTRNDVNVLTSIWRNPYWRHGSPGQLDGADIHWNQDPNTVVGDVEAGRLDEVAGVSAAQRQPLADGYGVGSGRFRVRPSACIGYVALNGRNRLLRNNPQLRKAISFAVDRTAYVGSAGPFGATPWSHLVPSGTVQAYPLHPNLARARALARGHLRQGKIPVYYRSSGSVGPAQGELLRRALIGLGFEPAKVAMKGFSGGDIYTAIGMHPSEWDVSVSLGLCSKLRSGFGRPDPAGYLDGFASGAYPKRLEAAQRLRGSARVRALAALDLALMRNVAPAVVTSRLDSQFFFSDRVDPHSLAYQPSVANWSIASLALK